MMNRCSVVCIYLSLLQLVLVTFVASQSTVPPPIASKSQQPKRIDTHCHYVPPFYKELLDSLNITSGGRPIPTWNASAHLAVNAEFGIETSVLSISTPGARISQTSSVEDGRSLARKLNEYGSQLTVEYPKQFLFFASLTLPDVDGAVAEAIYALDTLKAAGIILEASFDGENVLGTSLYAPLYKVLNDRHATVFIHPSDSPCPQEEERTKAIAPESVPPYVIDFLLDTSRAAVNLVYRNVTRDYPNIKFILGHSGGFLPFAANRAAGALALLSSDLTAQPYFYAEFQKFHADVALSATATALPSTLAFFNNTQITFGSDYPYAPVEGVAQNTNYLQSYSQDRRSKRRINYQNAYRLFRRFLK